MEPDKQKDEATVRVPGKGGEPPKEGAEPLAAPGPNPELAPGEKLVELTQEDRELKERLELAVERLGDPQEGVVRAALELLRKELREATSSMTSVPKPLKFLGPHYAKLKGAITRMGAGDNKRAWRRGAPCAEVCARPQRRPPPSHHGGPPLPSPACSLAR